MEYLKKLQPPAPHDMLVTLHEEKLIDEELDTISTILRVNSSGEVHGITFDVDGGESIYLKIHYTCRDKDYNHRTCTIDFDSLGVNSWSTADQDIDKISDDTSERQNYFTKNKSPSLGLPDRP